MPEVHASAVLRGEVELAEDVVIGPGCVLDGELGAVKVGGGTRLLGHAWLYGPLVLGPGNTVYPFACLGLAPQHAKFDLATPGPGLVVGEDNIIREQVTMHRAYEDARPTRVGDGNMFMVGAHVGHDCTVGNDCTMVNNTALGGHVEVADRVTIGGATAVHQFCRIGEGAMLAGGHTATRDIPAWFMLTAASLCGAVNLIGMRRHGLTSAQIDQVRWAHRTMCRERHPRNVLLQRLRERSGDPLIDAYIAFVETSKRGIQSGRGQSVRGTG